MDIERPAKKLGKRAEPTPEELEFIYECFQKNLSNEEVLEELNSEGFPLSRSLGFIKRRRREFNAAKKVIGEQAKKEFDPILIERRKEHWDELSKLAALLLSFWEEYFDKRVDNKGLITIASQFKQIDDFLASFLLDHLQAEFTQDFSAITDWTDLIKIDSGQGIVSRLALVARRKTFKGTCQVCREYI